MLKLGRGGSRVVATSKMERITKRSILDDAAALDLLLLGEIGIYWVDKTHYLQYFQWPQSAFTCSKLTIKTMEQGVKYVHS